MQITWMSDRAANSSTRAVQNRTPFASANWRALASILPATPTNFAFPASAIARA
jgi:hypothetical protein